MRTFVLRMLVSIMTLSPIAYAGGNFKCGNAGVLVDDITGVKVGRGYSCTKTKIGWEFRYWSDERTCQVALPEGGYVAATSKTIQGSRVVTDPGGLGYEQISLFVQSNAGFQSTKYNTSYYGQAGYVGYQAISGWGPESTSQMRLENWNKYYIAMILQQSFNYTPTQAINLAYNLLYVRCYVTSYLPD